MEVVRSRGGSKWTHLFNAAGSNELISKLSSDLLDLIALVGNQV